MIAIVAFLGVAQFQYPILGMSPSTDQPGSLSLILATAMQQFVE